MISKNLQITNALRKHFDRAYHLCWKDSTSYILELNNGFKLAYEYSNEDLEKYNPYDIVNFIWDDIYKNFSKWNS
jgi:hypothetical protein